ncbi:hypothetical protein [Amycolatopsis sp. FDAARGOS 1241]|uniref:hypothetical protein n=1 Tax=Amycolatopsis sp. FDAARGOS 1241 TaxID=2778070 RepID=UPI00194FC2C9|nr:hypothetical protein [Amycolatopsis sp. FDAARGOS 1241]QRP44058.1 hypothetical protein I6J71_32805 [Amycolatopsis sp. FDAARGOS 1241]
MRLVIHADQRQFSLRDKTAWLPGDGGWSDEAVTSHRVAVEPSSLAVATARSDLVEADLTLHPAEPPLLADAEHVVEADLAVPSGRLTVAGPADYPGQEHVLDLAPGRYRVRVSYVEGEPPATTWNEHEYGEHYRYVVDLWPSAEPRPVTVVRQGAAVWDG